MSRDRDVRANLEWELFQPLVAPETQNTLRPARAAGSSRIV